MKYLKQLSIIFILCIIGEIISYIVPFPFSGSVISLIILFVSLMTKFIKLEQIEDVSKFLISILSFLFISTTVSVIQYYDLIKEIFIKLLIICSISAVATFLATAWMVNIVIYWTERKK